MTKNKLLTSLIFFIYFFCGTFNICLAQSHKHGTAPKFLTRLPDYVKAEFYDLRMFFNLTVVEGRPHLITNGTVTMLLKVSRDTQSFFLSADDQLNIRKGYFSPGSGLEVTSVEVLGSDSMVKFNLNKVMETGSLHNFTLEFSPSKKRASSLQGLFIVNQLGAKGKFFVNTHMEPIYARHVLPCFDEPSFKSRFKVTIIHKNSYKSMSNMPLENKTPVASIPGYVKSEFQITPTMSPYLLALVVHNLSSINASFKSIDGRIIPLTFYTEDILMRNAEIAVNMSVQIFTMYEEWFGIPYPMPKIDFFTTRIPALAMENWGIISMSINMFVPKFFNPQHIAMILSHEIAHQWFGNLVTPSWWTDLWLKEGFATYLSLLAARNISNDRFTPVHLLEILRITKRDIMDQDSLSSSNPVSRPIRTDEDIVANFDKISYGKSCLLISMIRETMVDGLSDTGGEMVTHGLKQDPFIKGASDYVKKFAYSTASNQQMWESFTNVGNIFSCAPLQEIMKTWTEECGYPVVGFDVNYETGNILITQKRFVSDFSRPHKKVVWTFQLLLVSSKGLKRTFWVSQSQQTLTVDPELIGDWIMVSTPARSYYRVNYDFTTWRKLIYAMAKKSDIFSSLQKSDLFDDSWALAFAGELPLEVPLLLTSRAVINETDDIFWNTVFDVLISRVKVYTNTSIQHTFASYCLQALAQFPPHSNRDPIRGPKQDVVKLLYEQLSGELKEPNFMITLRDRFKKYEDSLFREYEISTWLTLCYAVKEFGLNDTMFHVVTDMNHADKYKLSMAYYTSNYSQFLDLFKLARSKSPYTDHPLLWHPKRLTDCGPYAGSEFMWNYVMDNWNSIWNDTKPDQMKQLLVELHFSNVHTKDKLSRMHLFEKAYSDTLGVARNSFMEAKQRAIRHVYWTENRFADKIGRWINRTLNTTYLV